MAEGYEPTIYSLFPTGRTQYNAYPTKFGSTSYFFVPMDYILLNKKTYDVSDVTACGIIGTANLLSYVVSVSDQYKNGLLIQLSYDLSNYMNNLCYVEINIP